MDEEPRSASITQVLTRPDSEGDTRIQRLELQQLSQKCADLQKIADALSTSVDRVEKATIRFEGVHSLFSDRLARLERVVYSGCGIALTALLTALIYLVVKR